MNEEPPNQAFGNMPLIILSGLFCSLHVIHHTHCTQKWFYFSPQEAAATFPGACILLDVYLLDSVHLGLASLNV